jgi:hypothetical protein
MPWPKEGNITFWRVSSGKVVANQQINICSAANRRYLIFRSRLLVLLSTRGHQLKCHPPGDLLIVLLIAIKDQVFVSGCKGGRS